jgi:hypothetical protein
MAKLVSLGRGAFVRADDVFAIRTWNDAETHPSGPEWIGSTGVVTLMDRTERPLNRAAEDVAADVNMAWDEQHEQAKVWDRAHF